METRIWTYPMLILDCRVEKSNRQRGQSTVEYNFECHLFIDVFKALEMDEITKWVKVKIRRGPQALQH